MKKLMLALVAVVMIGALGLTSAALACPGSKDKAADVHDTENPKKPA